MKNLTLKNIAMTVEGELRSGDLQKVSAGAGEDLREAGLGAGEAGLDLREATAVVLDSRKIEPGAVFVATRGERVDGHDFIKQVFEAGALGVICEQVPEGVIGPCIVVEDSFVALKKLAAYYRSVMSDVKIVGIVGSVGKTSTKELVASVLGEHFNTLKTEGNFNNEVGVPLTLLRLRDEHEAAVVEMGISDFHEMDRLGTMVKPDGVVMTNIGPCHLEKLIDLDGVLKAKSEVFPHIKAGGFLVLNGEDEKLNTVKSFGDLRIARFGMSGEEGNTSMEGQASGTEGDLDVAAGGIEGNLDVVADGIEGNLDVAADEVKSLGLEGSEFRVSIRGSLGKESGKGSGKDSGKDSGKGSGKGSGKVCFDTKVPLPGRHMVMNALAATAVAREFGLTLDEINRGIRAVKPVAGRSNLIKTEKYLLVDDCYNANPKSMKAAVDLMSDALGRKVAILGDMFELGENEAALHGEVGSYAVTHGIDMLICVGALSKNMYEAAVKAAEEAKVKYFATRDELAKGLGKVGLKSGDTVLVKASHGMGFDEVIKQLKALQ